MTQSSGRQLLGSAAIVGVAVIAGSVLVALSLNKVSYQLDRSALRLDEIRSVVAEAKQALDAPRGAPQAARRPQNPDLNRRFSVKTAGAPSIGPETAAVTVVGFSDFQ